jgi:hypothetical protein
MCAGCSWGAALRPELSFHLKEAYKFGRVPRIAGCDAVGLIRAAGWFSKEASMEKIWLKGYPAGVPHEIDLNVLVST